MPYFIGLMSGTSVDSIDAVVCEIQDSSAELICSLSFPIPNSSKQSTQQKIHQVASGNYSLDQGDPIEQLGHLDLELGQLFSQAVDALLDKAKLTPKQITAIGSHGQTIRHIPNHPQAFSMQIGDPNVIAANTGITTVADFRRRDMALGGQGAPLVPAFHQALFASDSEDRVIVNLGGIANITLLAKDQDVIGYDTGPANTLMDQWISKHQSKDFDRDGAWAKSGELIPELLSKLLSESYFAQSYPKSTGRELFSLKWLESQLKPSYQPQDVQRTLLELTAVSLADAVQKHLSSGAIYLCGGGAHNAFLVERLQNLLANFKINSSYKLGVDPDWMEAMAFAWLSFRTLNNLSGNLPAVTGASQTTLLGAIYPA